MFDACGNLGHPGGAIAYRTTAAQDPHGSRRFGGSPDFPLRDAEVAAACRSGSHWGPLAVVHSSGLHPVVAPRTVARHDARGVHARGLRVVAGGRLPRCPARAGRRHRGRAGLNVTQTYLGRGSCTSASGRVERPARSSCTARMRTFVALRTPSCNAESRSSASWLVAYGS